MFTNNRKYGAPLRGGGWLCGGSAMVDRWLCDGGDMVISTLAVPNYLP